MSAKRIMGRNCPTTLLNIDIVTIVTIMTIITIMAGLLFGFPGEGFALPIWPSIKGPDGKLITEDRIGYEYESYQDEYGNHQEFRDYSLDSKAVIEYRVGDDWGKFPSRLNSKKHYPHTVNILFEMDNAATDAQSLVIAAKPDPPMGQQHLGVFLDGRPIHNQGGEEIQPSSPSQENAFQENAFQEYTFWLGYLARGEHRITLSNVTDPNSQTNPDVNFGILFDYLKLVPGATVGISLSADAENAAVMKDFTALESNDHDISGSILPKAHFYAGFWNLRITGLEPGGGVKVEIHCPPESFFALQEYYTHDGSGPEYEWKAMKIAKDPASSTVTVEIFDGGAGDADLTRDGSISHIGGIAVPFSLGGGYDYQGCFISSLSKIYWLLLR